LAGRRVPPPPETERRRRPPCAERDANRQRICFAQIRFAGRRDPSSGCYAGHGPPGLPQPQHPHLLAAHGPARVSPRRHEGVEHFEGLPEQSLDFRPRYGKGRPLAVEVRHLSKEHRQKPSARSQSQRHTPRIAPSLGGIDRAQTGVLHHPVEAPPQILRQIEKVARLVALAARPGKAPGLPQRPGREVQPDYFRRPTARQQTHVVARPAAGHQHPPPDPAAFQILAQGRRGVAFVPGRVPLRVSAFPILRHSPQHGRRSR